MIWELIVIIFFIKKKGKKKSSKLCEKLDSHHLYVSVRYGTQQLLDLSITVTLSQHAISTST